MLTRIIQSCYLLISIVAIASCTDVQKSAVQSIKTTTIDSSIFNLGIRAQIKNLLDYKVDALGFPRSMESDKSVRRVKSSDWTSGFFPGSLMYLYEITEDQQFLTRAEQWLIYLEKEKNNGKTHDMGFKINCSFGNAFRLTKKEAYKKVIIQSAKTLVTRFDPKVGCIKSWDFGVDKWQFPVIIDNMMNLELLFEATILSGDSIYHEVAVSHARKTLENHYRADNSSYHVIDYDTETGDVLQRITHQGHSAESVWSRGQAWGLYGFTMVYRYTQDSLFLDQAIKIADYILAHPHLPKDKIPYWDLADPAIPNAPRDVSAAAVIASGLLELDRYVDGTIYEEISRSMLMTMSSSDYTLNEEVSVPFLLDHSTGNMPKSDEIDLPINYADYYFLEAITRFGE